jgi:hypothetical protein
MATIGTWRRRNETPLPLWPCCSGILCGVVLAIASSACAADEPHSSEKWPGARYSLASLSDSAASVVAGVARDEAVVRKRDAAHVSTSMAIGDGNAIRGGGILTFAHCRQKFEVRDLLHGMGEPGDRELAYRYVERAEGFPLPDVEEPVPEGAEVILLLHEKGRILKALPDTPEIRTAVRDAFPRNDGER